MQEVLEMKKETKLRHWLHIILVLLTGGLWLAVYGLRLAINEMNNRVVRGYNQGWKDAQVSVSQRNIGMSWQGGPLIQALNRSSAGVPQAALQPWEADLYNHYRTEIEEGCTLHPVDQAMYEHLRSRFK